MISVLLVAGSLTSAGGVEFYKGSWAEALKEAEKAKKLVFADFYTDW